MDARAASAVTLPPAIVLPYYVDVASAYQKTDTVKATGNLNQQIETTVGNFTIPLYITHAVGTTAVAGTRTVSLVIRDQALNIIARSFPTTTQAASLLYFYNWFLNLGTPYAVTGVGSATGVQAFGTIPPIAIPPDWNLDITMSQPDPGDTIQAIVYTRIVIPTIGEGYNSSDYSSGFAFDSSQL